MSKGSKVFVATQFIRIRKMDSKSRQLDRDCISDPSLKFIRLDRFNRTFVTRRLKPCIDVDVMKYYFGIRYLKVKWQTSIEVDTTSLDGNIPRVVCGHYKFPLNLSKRIRDTKVERFSI